MYGIHSLLNTTNILFSTSNLSCIYFKLQDQLKAVSKHYMKLVENRPNIVIGTSYAHLKECLLKIEKSGYLNYMIKARNEEVSEIFIINSLFINKLITYF